MSRRLVHELTYDAPAADVAAMLADPAFRQAVCDFQGVLRADISITTPTDGHTEVVIDQWQSTTGFPSFAKKIVGEETNIVQAESWSTPLLGDIVVTIPGKPGDMRGTATLSESGGTTTETVDLTVKVGIPLVGGKIEALIADMLLKALRAENKVGRDYLSR
ncbi:DUF2505 domain-containing protein [Nocardioides sp.]|uniref:DUF2505 domain-containing protein n=1 Tax=Nocardioides sp. TaxID=35761 RepID=UPI00286D037F|nr:DUF2505 domain-containing protein [Nocardioides sp.]